MLSQVSSSPYLPESPFFDWTCLKDPCGGGGASNAERGGEYGVANARRDGGVRREGERTTPPPPPPRTGIRRTLRTRTIPPPRDFATTPI